MQTFTLQTQKTCFQMMFFYILCSPSIYLFSSKFKPPIAQTDSLYKQKSISDQKKKNMKIQTQQKEKEKSPHFGHPSRFL